MYLEQHSCVPRGVLMGWDGMGDGSGNKNRWNFTVQRAHEMGWIVDRVCAGYRMCKPWGEGRPGVPRVLSPEGWGVISIVHPDLAGSCSVCCMLGD